MDLVFYVSAIKIDVDVSHSIQEQYNSGHHVNMQLIKIPTTSYAMQQRDGGII